MIIYGMNNDGIVSPMVIVILGSVAWVFALIDFAIDAVFPPHLHRADQE